MAKGPIIIPLRCPGTSNPVHYPLQDTLTAIDDIQRQKYNKELICKVKNIYTYFRGVSDGGDIEVLRNDNYKRLFPWYKTMNTSRSISCSLSAARRNLNTLLRLNNPLMGVTFHHEIVVCYQGMTAKIPQAVQPTAASNLPPKFTPAQ
ncbi:uncharacterized protein EAF01_000510 [Botrytis porri]|uniref:uncharacterized protein n=1 Tax=Botrytis porri TaxID=87229 RepID=UPI001901994F|nr:uncharacterized protein EAF01_000510 [Botrytis porri]KAF7914104.1 hypothetical protein EAF01_000510 [Botrytis porri]